MKTILVAIVLQTVLLTGFFFLIDGKKEKTAYVRLEKIYQDFKLKKDLENKFKNIESKRKSILDSLEMELRLVYQRLQNIKADQKLIDDYEQKKQIYFQRKQQFTEDNQVVMDDYHKQIINKISERVAEYGKQKDYDYIFGTEPGGAVMHARESKDITEEVLRYMNTNY